MANLDLAREFFFSGLASVQERQYEEAEALFRQALSHAPDRVSILSNLSAVLLKLGKLEEAQACAMKSLEIDPKNPEGWSNLGLIQIQQGAIEPALESLGKSLEFGPDNAAALLGLGNVYKQKGDLDRAAQAYQKVLSVSRDQHACSNAWSNLGGCYKRRKDFENALDCYDKALALAPFSCEALTGRGNVYLNMARYDEALRDHESAQRLSPDLPEPLLNKAFVLVDMQQSEEAIELLQQGIVRFQNSKSKSDMQFLLSVTALSIGQWELGWRYYTARYTTERMQPLSDTVNFPEGSALRVLFDQGLGDELFFLRYAKMLSEKGCRIDYVTQPKLFNLLRNQPFLNSVEDVRNIGDKSDHDLFVGDLPFIAYRMGLRNVPPSLQLTPDVNLVEKFAKQLSEFGEPPFLAVTWHGGASKGCGQRISESDGFLFKEVPAGMLGSLLRSWPGSVIVIQREPLPADLQAFGDSLGKPFLDWTGLNDDLTEILAALSLLDEYVGVSNTNMHLLAGLNKAARVLVPHPPEWRWMAEGEVSPWFPKFKIYRQSRELEWQPALNNLALDLAMRWGK